MGKPSLFADLAKLSPAKREAIINSLTPQELMTVTYDWQTWARPEQLYPVHSGLLKWMPLGGRGWGKSRTGAEFVRWQVEKCGVKRIALVGRTAADVRDVMVTGKSGLLSVCPPWNMPSYKSSEAKVIWPNGAEAKMYSGDKPDSLRGPEHEAVWLDEFAAHRYAPAVWSNLLFGLRLGKQPKVIITTTPKNTPMMRELIADPTIYVTKGSSYDNRANLPASFFDEIIKRYDGTRLGRQEIYAELLADSEGALWKRDNIESARVSQVPTLTRIVVAIDPSVTSAEESAETGIIVAGVAGDNYYILADNSLRGTPHQWAMAAVGAYRTHKADRLIGEANNGGDLIEANIRTVDKNVAFRKVHASRGKATRAEPIASLYEQGRVHHVGYMAELEDQMCSWQPGEISPDRLDAMVWAITELSSGGGWSWG
jgi:phage terminase large subunit-like protein